MKKNAGEVKRRERSDRRYRRGTMDPLKRLYEIARFSLIVGYFEYFKGGGSILDVGCGVGILVERLGPHAYSQYVGLDLEGEPIRVASRNTDDKTVFRCADANTYTPAETYDAVVFSESLYYLADPLEVVHRYARCLKRDGVLIVSMVAFPGMDRYWKGLEAAYRVLDEATVSSKSGISWTCKVLLGNARSRRHNPSAGARVKGK
jgi:2-polyprenyl-3-methyl-5-hydroxy-6-metoxy-1,4-benzoquinol methylase